MPLLDSNCYEVSQAESSAETSPDTTMFRATMAHVRAYMARNEREQNGDREQTAAVVPVREPHIECKRTGRYIPLSLAEARDARTRARNTPNKRASRAKHRAADEAERAAMLASLAELDMPPAPRLNSQVMANASRAWTDWLAIDGHRQRQYRGREASYLGSYLTLLQARLELDIEPGPSEFAARLLKETGETFTRQQAWNRHRQLVGLEGESGPWSR